MKLEEYIEIRDALGWTSTELAAVIGKTTRTLTRYASGYPIPGPTARLLRLLYRDRYTMSKERFKQLVEGLKQGE